jgi:K+-transporting ATPase c subunit
MALLNFAYFKQIRPVQSTFTPATPITTSVITEDVEVLPFPAALGVLAPSTVIADKFSKTQWFSAKPWSAYFASASAATNAGAAINFF